MSNTTVPKVSLVESIGQIASPASNVITLGMIARSSLANGAVANTIYDIQSLKQAEYYFGSNWSNARNLVPMIKAAFDEGASRVKAISIGEPTTGNHTFLGADADAGATTITVVSGTQLTSGDTIYIGTNSTYDYEEKRTVNGAPSGNVITLNAALTFAHYSGERVQVITPPVSTDYSTAITEMGMDEDKSLVTCELNDDATTVLMKAMCDDSYTNYYTPCVFIRCVDSDINAAAAIVSAGVANDDRVVLLYPTLKDFNGKTLEGNIVSSAVAGAISKNGIPKLNHNYTQLVNFGNVYARITDYDALINGGVTPIELKNSTIRVVRFITTWLLKNGVLDTTWKEAAVRLNVDYMEKTIQNRLQSLYMQKGNTERTREAIKQTIISALQEFEAQEIIKADATRGLVAYKTPVITTDAGDSTKVNAEIQICPTKPLNFITLNFTIYV